MESAHSDRNKIKLALAVPFGAMTGLNKLCRMKKGTTLGGTQSFNLKQQLIKNESRKRHQVLACCRVERTNICSNCDVISESTFHK